MFIVSPSEKMRRKSPPMGGIFTHFSKNKRSCGARQRPKRTPGGGGSRGVTKNPLKMFLRRIENAPEKKLSISAEFIAAPKERKKERRKKQKGGKNEKRKKRT